MQYIKSTLVNSASNTESPRTTPTKLQSNYRLPDESWTWTENFLSRK